MKCKYLLLGFALALFTQNSYAQSAFDLYSASQTDLKGTARFMSMAGAFGALGGDISTLAQNPGGIGIYRSSDINFSFDWNFQTTKTNGEKLKNDAAFSFNNFGYVGSLKIGNDVMPNFNWGFSYNRLANFNRRYMGAVDNIQNSMTNYVAGQTNDYGWKASELGESTSYNPYLDSNAPWMSILSYNSYLINPLSVDDNFVGLYQNGTTGFAEFEVEEKGHLDEYTISFGGNIYDILYWGASVGIQDLEFNQYTYYGESLDNAFVPYETSQDGNLAVGNGYSSWGIENSFRMYGTGANFKLGVILKPINELRLGFAFHTPTFFSLKSEAYASTSFMFETDELDVVNNIRGGAETDQGYIAETWFDAQSPWKVMIGAAGVIGGRGLLSFNYERNMYPTMKVEYDGREDRGTTDCVKAYYKASDIFRIGGEFKLTPQFAVRAGYSYQTSPSTEEIKSDELNVVTAGTTLSYTTDDNIQYVTAGLGYRSRHFYADFAYLHKIRNTTFHAFSPDDFGIAPTAEVKDSNNEIVLSFGFRF